MRHLLKLLLAYYLVLTACESNEKKQKAEVQRSSSDTLQTCVGTKNHNNAKLVVVDSDTLTIDTKTAVFFYPDTLQMEKRMKEIGEEEFRIGADDYIYYINTSVEFLENQGLSVIDAKNKKYLRFLMRGKKEEIIKLDTLDELWGMYLFDPNKKPHYADISLIEADYKSYFGISSSH